MIRMTPFKCGMVTCQNWFQVPAPSMRAARSNPSGTVCNPASQHDHDEWELFPDVDRDQVGMT